MVKRATGSGGAPGAGGAGDPGGGGIPGVAPVMESARQAVGPAADGQAALWHDLFNLGALPVLLGCVLSDRYPWNFSAMAFYFAGDILWILVWPSCVRSPRTIMIHHLLVSLLCLVLFYTPEAWWVLRPSVLIELNTFMLIARRRAHKHGLPLWLRKIISFLFYTSWVAIRNILFPRVVWLIWEHYQRRVAEGRAASFVALDPVGVGFLGTCCLTFLNMKWSYDLFASKIPVWCGKVPSADKGKEKGL